MRSRSASARARVEPASGALRVLVLFLIRQYQRWLAPFTRGACRHYPTCSEFAAQAIERRGVVRGAWLALKRLMRCHPFGSSGFDPVP